MIHSFKFASENVKDIGRVSSVNASLVKVVGLTGGVMGEGISFEDGTHGRIISIRPEYCEVVSFSRTSLVIGIQAARTGKPLMISVGEGLLTHVISPLGYVIDERRSESKHPEDRPVDIKPLGISARRKISKFMTTGVPIVDLMVPIGEGQRELIIGNKTCGKTFFILSTIITQARQGKICVLGLIGKKKVEIKRVEKILEETGVIKNCVIVASFASDTFGEVYLTPYTAMTVAEYFRDQGRDVIVTLDDMTTHAKYFRERSLLAGMFPGRESYPGDIFYVQSKILERAGNFVIRTKDVTPAKDVIPAKAGIKSPGSPIRSGMTGPQSGMTEKIVSITCLPVAETTEADLTGYIQTNLMSMTDGHIFFDSDLFFRGIRPAVNIFLSVTRVGRQTQPKELKVLSQKILILLKKAQDLERFLRFGSEVTDLVRDVMDRGGKIWEFFKKNSYDAIPTEAQVVEVKKILGEEVQPVIPAQSPPGGGDAGIQTGSLIPDQARLASKRVGNDKTSAGDDKAQSK